MKNQRQITRRSFLKGTVVATFSTPVIVPSSVFGANAPSNRIVMGAIGVGSQGTGDMQGFLSKSEVQMVAICDVDKGHRDNAKRIVDERYGNKDCTAYHDFRKLISRSDLDAVQLALPDHWHAIPAIAAARAGIDIHGQKPLARSIREGRAICDAVHRYGRVWQTGSQQRSDYNFRRACELVRNGRIGKILKIEVGLPTGTGDGSWTTQAASSRTGLGIISILHIGAWAGIIPGRWKSRAEVIILRRVFTMWLPSTNLPAHTPMGRL
jgi:predicted dehydrogenase